MSSGFSSGWRINLSAQSVLCLSLNFILGTLGQFSPITMNHVSALWKKKFQCLTRVGETWESRLPKGMRAVRSFSSESWENTQLGLLKHSMGTRTPRKWAVLGNKSKTTLHTSRSNTNMVLGISSSYRKSPDFYNQLRSSLLRISQISVGILTDTFSE